MLCFWLLEPEKFKLHTKDKSGDECYGCSVYNPECATTANHAVTHTFRVYYILTGVGIRTLFVCMQGFLRT